MEQFRERDMMPQVWLSIAVITGFILITVALFVVPDTLSEWAKGMIGAVVGLLIGMLKQITDFWFGSSESSKMKTAALADAAAAANK